MGLRDVLRRGRPPRGARRSAAPEDVAHLTSWASARHGVEAYVEPPTAMTELTVVLVAHDGEWTRRRIAGERGARRLGETLKIPVYDVQRTGYPQRMRDHDERLRILRDRERRSDLC